MAVTFQSIRFGTVEIADEQVIEFPFGLIGLGGLRYTLLDRNPGTGFLWLHEIDNPALALPVVSPYQFFADFKLEITPEDGERIGLVEATQEGAPADGEAAAAPESLGVEVAGVTLYVTVRATPDPLDITANLRAPLVIHEGRGYQVLNVHEDAPLQAPLFTLSGSSAKVARTAGEQGDAAKGGAQPQVAS